MTRGLLYSIAVAAAASFSLGVYGCGGSSSMSAVDASDGFGGFGFGGSTGSGGSFGNGGNTGSGGSSANGGRSGQGGSGTGGAAGAAGRPGTGGTGGAMGGRGGIVTDGGISANCREGAMCTADCVERCQVIGTRTFHCNNGRLGERGRCIIPDGGVFPDAPMAMDCPANAAGMMCTNGQFCRIATGGGCTCNDMRWVCFTPPLPPAPCAAGVADDVACTPTDGGDAANRCVTRPDGGRQRTCTCRRAANNMFAWDCN